MNFKSLIAASTLCSESFYSHYFVKSEYDSNIKLFTLILSLQKLNLKNLCEIHSLFTEEQLEINFVVNNGSKIFTEVVAKINFEPDRQDFPAFYTVIEPVEIRKPRLSGTSTFATTSTEKNKINQII